MDWRVVDEGLIRRGELLLSLDFLERYDLTNKRRTQRGRIRPQSTKKLKFNSYGRGGCLFPVFWRLARSQPSLWFLSKPPNALPRILQHYL
jgi:hypothetical protein